MKIERQIPSPSLLYNYKLSEEPRFSLSYQLQRVTHCQEKFVDK